MAPNNPSFYNFVKENSTTRIWTLLEELRSFKDTIFRAIYKMKEYAAV